MKVRADFVTNSSSVSFVLFFDRVPASAEDLDAILSDPNNPNHEKWLSYTPEARKGATEQLIWTLRVPNDFTSLFDCGDIYINPTDPEEDLRGSVEASKYDVYKMSEEQKAEYIAEQTDPEKALRIYTERLYAALNRSVERIIKDMGLRGRHQGQVFYTWGFEDDCGTPSSLKAVECMPDSNVIFLGRNG